MVQLSHPHMATRKTIALTIWIFVGKVISLLFNTSSRFAIAFLIRSKYILISWLQSPSTLILEPKKIKSVTVSIFFPYLFAMKWWDQMPWSLFFWMLSFKLAFLLSSFTFIKRLFSSYFLPLEWYHLHIWDCWYFSQQSWFQLVLNPAQHFTWCTLHRISISRVTIYSLDILHFQFLMNIFH